MTSFRALAAGVCASLAAPLWAQGDAAAGYALFEMNCAQCHGTEAHGDGPMAEILAIAPPDLTGLAEAGEFPTARVARQIDGRDPMLAHGGEMPVYGQVFEGDDVVLRLASGQPMMTSRPIADLLAWLQEIQDARD